MNPRKLKQGHELTSREIEEIKSHLPIKLEDCEATVRSLTGKYGVPASAIRYYLWGRQNVGTMNWFTDMVLAIPIFTSALRNIYKRCDKMRKIGTDDEVAEAEAIGAIAKTALKMAGMRTD